MVYVIRKSRLVEEHSACYKLPAQCASQVVPLNQCNRSQYEKLHLNFTGQDSTLSKCHRVCFEFLEAPSQVEFKASLEILAKALAAAMYEVVEAANLSCCSKAFAN